MRALYLICLSLCGMNSMASEINICAEDAWPPHSYAQNNKAVGSSIELIQDAYKNSRYTLKFTSASYHRCLKMTQSGNFSAMINVALTQERRPQFLWPNTPLLSIKLLLIGRDTAQKPSYDVLRGKRIGVTLGYEYPDALQADPSIMQIVSNTELNSLRQLSLGRVDYILLSESSWANLRPQLSAAEQSKLKNLGVIDQLAIYLAFNRDHPEAAQWAAEFDEGMRAISAKRPQPSPTTSHRHN